MTKINNAGSNIWNLLEQPAVSKSEDSKQIKDVVPELKGNIEYETYLIFSAN